MVQQKGGGEGRRMTVGIISLSNSKKIWDWAGIKLATPGSAVRHTSVARHITDCATCSAMARFTVKYSIKELLHSCVGLNISPGWNVFYLLPNTQNKFSRNEAHIYWHKYRQVNLCRNNGLALYILETP